MDPRVAYLWGVVTAFGVIGGGWLILRLLAPWFMARATGVPISLVQIFGMRMRGSDPALIITASNKNCRPTGWRRHGAPFLRFSKSRGYSARHPPRSLNDARAASRRVQG